MVQQVNFQAFNLSFDASISYKLQTKNNYENYAPKTQNAIR